jgi:hypothetical protein
MQDHQHVEELIRINANLGRLDGPFKLWPARNLSKLDAAIWLIAQ